MAGDGEKASAPLDDANPPTGHTSAAPDEADIEKTGSAPDPKPDVQSGTAYKVLVGHEGETIVITPEEEKKLLRKIDLNLMPLLCIVYGLNYLDKTTVSYASVMDLKFLWKKNWMR
ncbi:hypothetical protein PG987_003338 [Apiospora arundinis]